MVTASETTRRFHFVAALLVASTTFVTGLVSILCLTAEASKPWPRTLAVRGPTERTPFGMNLRLDTARQRFPQYVPACFRRRQRVQGCSVLAARSARCTVGSQSLHHSRPISRPTRWCSTLVVFQCGTRVRHSAWRPEREPRCPQLGGAPRRGTGGRGKGSRPEFPASSASYFVNSKR